LYICCIDKYEVSRNLGNGSQELWTGIVTTALTIFIETQALKTLSAAETTMLYSTEPIFGSIVAAIFLGESLGMNGVVGGAMILSGCLYSSIGVNSDANQV
jgi:drug/metabolite transporter (DMT)-like permease